MSNIIISRITLNAFFKVLIVALVIATNLTSCDNVNLYDESVIINNELENPETISTEDLNLSYVSLENNVLRLSVELTSNINLNKVIELGLVYSTEEIPNITDIKISSNTISISNNIDIINLADGQNYFFKAYVITNQGVLYSINQIEINIPETGPVITSQNDFSSLDNIESLFYPYGPYVEGPWEITTSNCIDGSCITTGQSYGGYIIFTSENPSNGYFEFWVNTFDPGYNNRIPKIEINGVETTDIDIVGGDTSSFEFMKLRVNNVYAGNITLKIDFEAFTNRIITYTIDEFKFYANQ